MATTNHHALEVWPLVVVVYQHLPKHTDPYIIKGTLLSVYQVLHCLSRLSKSWSFSLLLCEIHILNGSIPYPLKMLVPRGLLSKKNQQLVHFWTAMICPYQQFGDEMFHRWWAVVKSRKKSQSCSTHYTCNKKSRSHREQGFNALKARIRNKHLSILVEAGNQNMTFCRIHS